MATVEGFNVSESLEVTFSQLEDNTFEDNTIQLSQDAHFTLNLEDILDANTFLPESVVENGTIVPGEE